MSGAKLKLVREAKEDEKMAPQQKIIYDRLVKAGVGKEIDREEFVKELDKSGELKTKQTTDRVVSYYMQAFAKLGIAETIKPEPAPKAEKKADGEKGAKKSESAGKSPAESGEKKPEKPEKPATAAAA